VQDAAVDDAVVGFAGKGERLLLDIDGGDRIHAAGGDLGGGGVGLDADIARLRIAPLVGGGGPTRAAPDFEPGGGGERNAPEKVGVGAVGIDRHEAAQVWRFSAAGKGRGYASGGGIMGALFASVRPRSKTATLS